MLRRWLIRVPFLLALACALILWAVSYFYAVVFLSQSSGGWDRFAFAARGYCDMGEHVDDEPPSRHSATEFFHFERGAEKKDWPMTLPTTLGFYFGNPRPNESPWFEMVFPLWFPPVVLAVLNWFVWRKTRARAPGPAFPVETANR